MLESVERREPSYTVGGNINWYSHHGGWYEDSLKKLKWSYHMMQQSHSWAYMQSKTRSERIHVPQCSLRHSLQQPRHGGNLKVHQQRKG